MWTEILTLLTIFLAFAVLWFGVRRAMRASREVPERWRLISAVDPGLSRAIAIRDDLAARTRRGEPNVTPAFIDAADEVVKVCVALVEMRMETQRWLGPVTEAPQAKGAKGAKRPSKKARRKAKLSAGSPAEGAARRAPHLEELVASAANELKACAATVEAQGERAQERLATLAQRMRDRLDGEREAHALLARHFGMGA